MNLLKSINEAIKCDSLDEAVLIVQEAIGQSDGGIASIFFSDVSEVDWDNLATWERRILMSKYVAYEIRQEAYNI